MAALSLHSHGGLTTRDVGMEWASSLRDMAAKWSAATLMSLANDDGNGASSSEKGEPSLELPLSSSEVRDGVASREQDGRNW